MLQTFPTAFTKGCEMNGQRSSDFPKRGFDEVPPSPIGPPLVGSPGGPEMPPVSRPINTPHMIVTPGKSGVRSSSGQPGVKKKYNWHTVVDGLSKHSKD